jgi:hypothetical protein
MDPFSKRPVVDNFQETPAASRRSSTGFHPQFWRKRLFLTPPSFLDDVNWNVVGHAFSWPVQWDYVLEGIGEFFPYVAVYWMPMAGLISLVAFIASFAPSDDANEEPAEQSASDRDKPPV